MTIRTPNNSYYVSGASGGQNHTLPFGADRFEDDDLFVYVWNTSTEAWDKKTVTTHYTVSSTQVSFTSGNIPSTRVIVLRKTDVDEDFPKADFVAGASIKAQDLDNNQMQALRGIKELRDQKLSAVPSIAEDGTPSNPKMYANLDMNGYKVINQPAGYITSTDILDGTIATADVADSAITTAKIADSAVTTAKIAADAVNGTKIADDSINSEHYVDGSIDTAHIADAQITTAKIANDAVTADKLANTAVTAGSYTAADITVDAQGRVTAASSGTIGTSEIAADAITTAKILDANVTTAKIADSAVTTAKIADAELVELATMGGNTASALADLTQSEVQILDGATVTTAELNILDGVTATATELNQLDGNTLKASSTDFTSSTQFPSAAEIDSRITARIDPLGGFEAIADEDSFPATAPPAGTVVSIANANGLAVNSSGVGAGTRAGGSDAVVINGFPSTFNSTSLDDGIGLLVIATSTAHTYDFHRVVAKNEDVRQLSSDINDFKARYRIGSSNPTTDNDAGDLFFNTGTSKMLVRNAGNTAWQEVQAVGDFFINTLSSSSGTGGGSSVFNGSAYRFTLSNAPSTAQQLLVSINGVVQKPNSGTSQPSEGFALDGSDIILAAAPATAADGFFVTIGSSVGIGTPSDDTVSTAKIVDGAVTNAKVSSSAAIAGTKINPNFGSQTIGTTGVAGVGVSAPSNLSRFEVRGTASGQDVLHLSNSAGTNNGDAENQIRVTCNDNAAWANLDVQAYNTIFTQNGGEKARIDNSGNFGLGTSTPTVGNAGAKLLHIHNTASTGTRPSEIVFTNGNTGQTSGSGSTVTFYQDDFYFWNYEAQNLIFGTSATERARVDSAGRVMLGTTTAGVADADQLTIASPSSTGITIRGSTSGNGNVFFSDTTSGTGQYDGFIQYQHSSQALKFGTAASEKMRIDSSGRVGVATTPEAWSGFDVLEVNEASIASSGSGDAFFTANAYYDGAWKYKDGGVARNIYMNADGTVFRQAASGSADASISWSESMRIDTNGVVGVGRTPFTGAPGYMMQLRGPGSQTLLHCSTSSQGDSYNDGILFGTDTTSGYIVQRENLPIQIYTNNTERLRVLAGGGLTFNGDTAQSNALDDYEEGTWSPTVQGSTTAGTVTYNARVGKYTKIGDRVFFELYVDWTSGNGSGSQLHISGLPFTAQSSSPDYPATTIGYFHNLTFASNSSPGALVSSGNSYIYFYSIPNGGGTNTVIGYDGSGSIILTGHYKVN